MDGRGRLAQPLTGTENGLGRFARAARFHVRSMPLGWAVRRIGTALIAWQPPRGFGVAAVTALMLASGWYGTVRGGHLTEVAQQWQDLCDEGANLLGFRLAEVTLSGNKNLNHNEIFAAAGLTTHTSLPFLDLAAARERLLSVPWIAEATLKKFYPGTLEIEIKERDAFALWQRDGKVFVIAVDGRELQPFDGARFARLPLVVGAGAGPRAQELLDHLAAYPQLAQDLRAAVLVAQRRWNLRLKNGLDIRLPENDVDGALATLTRFDREQKLMSRDIVAVDLRLSDRITVQLSEQAAQARADAIKDKKKAKKGGDA